MSVCTAMATVSCTRAANGDLIATLDVTNVLVAVANSGSRILPECGT